tara:strand:+ start:555 stop:920 length:366 start_codon:yes stop_codon:yes gene_type:complete
LFGARQKKQKQTKSEQLEAQPNSERSGRSMLKTTMRIKLETNAQKRNKRGLSFVWTRSKRLQNDTMEKITKQPHLTSVKKTGRAKIFFKSNVFASFPESISDFQIYFDLIRFYTKYTCRKT